MKRGFTLIELMVVIALMGVMATVSISGYSAVTRGMSDRAALDAAKSIADAALQRANIDRSKTYLYLFDEVTKLDSDMSAGMVNGVAIAVRPTGRISAVPSQDLFCDEFADLNQAYSSLSEDDDTVSASEKESQAATFRLYNVADKTYATVKDGVFGYSADDVDLEAGVNASPRTFTMYGFKKVGGSATFKVGQQYGMEFMVTRLPPGYTFSSSVTLSSASDLGQKQVQILEIRPTDSSTPAFQVYARRPNGKFVSIGTTTNVKDGK